MANKIELLQNKIDLYQKIYDLAKEERSEASNNNYGKILFLQELRQQIFNQIEKIDECMNSEHSTAVRQNRFGVKAPKEDDSQAKVIDLIKNILKIDEETLKVVNLQRDETLNKIEQIGDARKQLKGYGFKKARTSGFFDDSI